MKLYIILIVFFSSLAQGIVIQVSNLSGSGCLEFVEKMATCREKLTCRVKIQHHGDQVVLKTFKMNGYNKEQKCRIFFSDKNERNTSVSLFELDKNELSEAKKYISELLKTKQAELTEYPCCAKSKEKKVFCTQKINNVSFLDVLNTDAYYGCKDKELYFPLKRKVIRYN